jgi:hypothetical protein
MINVFITIFIAIIIGVSLVGPLADQVQTAATSANSSGSTCTSTSQGGCSNAGLYVASSWGATILKMIPGFFVLIILGVVVAGLYSVFRQAGIV